MPIPYYTTIPLIAYDMLADNTFRATVNILQRLKVRDQIRLESLEMYEYLVKDGERIEDLAFRYYGYAGAHWIIMLANDIHNPYLDWPLSYDDLHTWIRAQYSTPTIDGLIYAYQTTHHYEESHGIEIDFDTFVATPENERLRVTLYEYINGENEKKRRIRLIDKKYTAFLEEELARLMKVPLT